MYESFFGFSEKPFSQLPDPDFLFFSKRHTDAFTMMEYGLMEQAGFTVITGEVGSGKTTLIRRLLAEMQADVTVGLINNTHENMDDLLRWVLLAFDQDYRGLDAVTLFDNFTKFVIDQYAQNKRTVLIIDEAQNLQPKALEELRMLANINTEKYQVLQLILVGQPQLLDLLKRPELLQFRQRISADYFLKGLQQTEAHLYILHRTRHAGREKAVFTSGACDLIYKVSRGIPRVINILCDGALVYAFADEKEIVDLDVVQALLDDKAESGLLQFNNDIPEQKQEQNDTRHNPQKSASNERQDQNSDLLQADQSPNDLPEPLQVKKQVQSLNNDQPAQLKTALPGQSQRSSQDHKPTPIQRQVVTPIRSRIDNSTQNTHAKTDKLQGKSSEAVDEWLLNLMLKNDAIAQLKLEKDLQDESEDARLTIPHNDSQSESQEYEIKQLKQAEQARTAEEARAREAAEAAAEAKALEVESLQAQLKRLIEAQALAETQADVDAAARVAEEARAREAAEAVAEAKTNELEALQAELRRLTEAQVLAETQADVETTARAAEEAKAREAAEVAEAKTIELEALQAELKRLAEAQALAETQADVEAKKRATEEAKAREAADAAEAKALEIGALQAELKRLTEAQALAEIQAGMEATARAAEEAKARQAAEKDAKAKALELKALQAELKRLAEAQALADTQADVEATARAVEEGKAREAAEAVEAKAFELEVLQAEFKRLTEAQALAIIQADVEVTARAAEEAKARHEAEKDAEAKALELKALQAEFKRLTEAQALAETQADIEAKIRAAEEAKAREAAEAVEAKAHELEKLQAELKRLAEAQALAETQADIDAKARAEAELRASQEIEERTRKEEDALAAELRRVEAEERARKAEELAHQHSLQQKEAEARAKEAIEERDQLVASAVEAEKLKPIITELWFDVRRTEDVERSHSNVHAESEDQKPKDKPVSNADHVQMDDDELGVLDEWLMGLMKKSSDKLQNNAAHPSEVAAPEQESGSMPNSLQAESGDQKPKDQPVPIKAAMPNQSTIPAPLQQTSQEQKQEAESTQLPVGKPAQETHADPDQLQGDAQKDLDDWFRKQEELIDGVQGNMEHQNGASGLFQEYHEKKPQDASQAEGTPEPVATENPKPKPSYNSGPTDSSITNLFGAWDPKSRAGRPDK